jgi:hypothetical protein
MPVYLDLELPMSPHLSPEGVPNDSAFWWCHETLTQSLFQASAETLIEFRRARDALESSFRDRVETARGESRGARGTVSQECRLEGVAFENRWRAALEARI